jgi:hypothetical protein
MSKARVMIFAMLLLLISWGVYQCSYRFSFWRDYQERPWAYSADQTAKLLVGRWSGHFVDPDGIDKSIQLEIFEPTSVEQREKRSAHRSRQSHVRGRDTRSFEGIATVSSRLGQEHYLIAGSVGERDYHQLRIGFRAEDESRRIRPNFSLNLTESGSWSGDEMSLRVSFAYFRADGSSFSDSADPRYQHLAALTLKRQ